MATEKQRLIFLSYSRTNRGFALELAKELKASGFLIWFDQLDIPTGARWDDEIEKALTDCEIFMVILTPQSIASHNVKDEIGYAIDSNKRILPILLEQANVPFRLRRFQYVDFTNKSNNEGIDAARQLLRKLIDEPTQPRQDSPGMQSPQPEVDRSAALKADANRLARQKAEAIRKAREQEQQERASQIVQEAPPPIETRAAQGQIQKQAKPRLVPIIAGVSILLLLCLGGVRIAWPYIFPPTTTPLPPITITNAPPITLTPTHTPIGPVPISTTTTPSPSIPALPIDFIEFYYENINNRNYDLTWSLLSEQYKAERNPDGKGPYMDFWNSVSRVDIYSLDYTEISSNSAIVVMDSNITATPLSYYLIWDSSRNTWLFNPMLESFDVTCSRAPNRLRVGIDAEVATASDTLALRSSPTDDYTVIERMTPGTIINVLEGPECKYYRPENIFFWWWKVQSPSRNQGWVVEGSDSIDTIFLKPAQ
jgi:hypothetical protein